MEYIIVMKDWTITFDDGSSATYFNSYLFEALSIASADWSPVKHPVRWHEFDPEKHEYASQHIHVSDWLMQGYSKES